MSGDPYNLRRFVEAQQPVYERALGELKRGRKTSHWMWFIFPQIAGLGSSATARHFAISSLAEARAYLDHTVLGPRLIECLRLLLALEDRTAEEIFGGIDAMKLRSCLTLFDAARPEEQVFHDALAMYYATVPDEKTLAIIRNAE